MSNITIGSAVVGTEVILLASNRFGDSPSNPAWEGSQGKVTGKIVDVRPQFIVVDWANGQRNHYDNDCLATVPVAAPIPVNTTVSLKTAVEDIIANNFIKNGVSFSAYDVTGKLRQSVNSGSVVIDGKPVENINGKLTQRIAHDEIRTFVRDYMNGVSSFDRRFNGDYIVYQPNGVATIPTVSTPVAVSAPSTPRLTFTPTGVSASGTASKNDADTANKLVIYITNKGSRTLKQIQSRFKVEGGSQPTVRELARIATAAGLRIDPKATFHQSVVTR